MAGFIVGLHHDFRAEIAARNAVGDFDRTAQRANDGADDVQRHENRDQHRDARGNQDIAFQRLGAGLGTLAGLVGLALLERHLFLDIRLIGALRRAEFFLEKHDGFFGLALLQQRQILVSRLEEFGARSLHLRQDGLAFAGGDQGLQNVELRRHIGAGRGDAVKRGLLDRARRENRQVAHLNGLLVDLIDHRVQGLGQRHAALQHVGQLGALAGGAPKTYARQSDQQQHQNTECHDQS